MPNITVYTRADCVQCKMTKRFLEQNGVPFKIINIDEKPEFIAKLKANGHHQIPVVSVEGVEEFTGFRPDTLKRLIASVI
ncbi:MAG: glutaredoxin-like protein NrdH [Lactobacillaceae bacterium]|jgi:glutaredoxin-like protein NrdH|nr:glutaredoxin-like protein NrdH [Lactobacillaceae bacterium]